jgi:hypothetical protein
MPINGLWETSLFGTTDAPSMLAVTLMRAKEESSGVSPSWVKSLFVNLFNMEIQGSCSKPHPNHVDCGTQIACFSGMKQTDLGLDLSTRRTRKQILLEEHDP